MRCCRSIEDLARATLGMALATTLAAGQVTTRVSVDSSGAETSGGILPAISADGQVVAFSSADPNLVAGDTNKRWDVFVHDRSTGITTRVSVDSSGAEGNDDSGVDRYVALSADGSIVAFSSLATNLVAGDTNDVRDVFVHDRVTGITERVSVGWLGQQAKASCAQPTISADGQVVAFGSVSWNLVADDKNWREDIFVRDRGAGTTERVSVDSSGAESKGISYAPAISADGLVVAFLSNATDLVSGDTNRRQDAFVHERVTGLTERVSVDSSGAEVKGSSYWPAISGDGKVVAFYNDAKDLVGTDQGFPDVYVRDRANGITERVSVSSSGEEGDSTSDVPSISADGQLVAFHSTASNLVPGDTNHAEDVFIHDRVSGRTERMSVDSSGSEGDSYSDDASISADGTSVAFQSLASNLVVGDTNQGVDVFVHQRCPADATSSTYGAGWPGTLGIPSLAVSGDPVLGTTITLDVGNSIFLWNIGFLFVGLGEQSLPLRNSGTLLVDSLVLFLPIAVGPNGSSYPTDLPFDHLLCGVSFFLQVLELDPGASRGLSFTPGLELVPGH